MPLHIDNREYPAAPERNLLEHCLSLGLNLPYFCWHPAMGSVGACRQCAVKQYRDEDDAQGRIVMACMTPAVDGTRIGLDEAEARDFRARVIEWLMVNHPHDCPVCEEGGECHLQDMTVMTGHNYRRYRGLKRTHRNQYLGPFINHEMNRCIACYRCVRFYQDYAGGADLRAFGAHHHVYFGRHEDGVLENEFSGNLAEVCPTGVFTDKPFSERYVRKWDLQSAPSVCVHCGVGCNISPQERYGRLRRIVNRYNGAVNEYFICDRGRFGYGFVNGDERVRVPLARSGSKSVHDIDRSGSLHDTDPESALSHSIEMLAGRVIGIGSPRASVESNFALRRLVGAENFYAGIPHADARLLFAAVRLSMQGATHAPSLREAADADAMLVLGEDVPNTAPRLALTLRQAARNRQKAIATRLGVPAWLDQPVRTAGLGQWSPLFIATAMPTRLDDLAAGIWRAAPRDIARLGFAIAHRLDPAAPEVSDLPAGAAELADRIAGTLAEAERPLIVSGGGTRSAAVIDAAASIARALGARRERPTDLALVLPECNSAGVALLATANTSTNTHAHAHTHTNANPNPNPNANAKANATAVRGASLDDALERVETQSIRAAIVLENDLAHRIPHAALERFRARVEHLIVVDHTLHETARMADVVLPAATFAEGDGTLISSEGRAQRFYQAFVPEGEVREAWRWLGELIRRRGESCDWSSLDDVTGDCAREVPALAAITAAAPPASFRVAQSRIPRAPARYSGRTAMHANVSIREPKPPPDPDAPLAFSMEGYYGRRVPPALMPYFWAPGWNSNQQSVLKFQDETGRALRGGNPGARLFDADPNGGAADSGRDPELSSPPPAESFEPDDRLPASKRALHVVPLHHVFGSDELSARSFPVSKRIPAPYVALGSEEAAARSLAEGELADITLGAATLTLPVRIMNGLALGVIGIPVLPGMPIHVETEAMIRPAADGEGDRW